MMKRNHKTIIYIGIACLAYVFFSCTGPSLVQKNVSKYVPTTYSEKSDSINSVKLNWRNFFTDNNLNELIDTAIKNNQELNITLQEIIIAQNEVRARKGEYLPFLNIGGSAGADKTGKYTRNGAVESGLPIKPGTAFPDPLPDFMLGANVSWELDIWKKLRNNKKAAVSRYLASVEGKNFVITNLIAEVANSYYELLSLDNHLEIVRKNLELQKQALGIVKLEKLSAKVTELAVKRFEAEVLKNQSRQYEIVQAIAVTENRINFLLGRFPQPIKRNSNNFVNLIPNKVFIGIPSQLLDNRPDIRQAELELAAAKLDVKVAKASFYPKLGLIGGVGYNAYNTSLLFRSPESLMYSIAGELIAPLVNRNALKANYSSKNAQQTQAIYNYEKTVLNAYIEVANQLSLIGNLESSYELKRQQVDALTQSIDISSSLFRSARADYMEVLLTQRDALDAKIELIETKKQQMSAFVDMYQALGGGWN